MEPVIKTYKQSRIVMLRDMITKGEVGLILSIVPVTSWLYQATDKSDAVAILTCSKVNKFVILGTPETIAEYVISLCMLSNVNITSLEVLPESCCIKHSYAYDGVVIRRQLEVTTPTDIIKSDFIQVIKLDI
jgi:hypothetical protein